MDATEKVRLHVNKLNASLDDDSPIDLDDVLPLVGEFGRYQKLLLWLVCLPACIPCGFCAFNQLFMADIPPHNCKLPAELDPLAIDPRILAIPTTEESNHTEYSSCYQYKLNWTEIMSYQDLRWYFSENMPNSSWPTMECQDGWYYNTTEILSSIVIDFDLVCGRDIYPTLGLVALNLGGPIGVYFFGVMNDRFGRKRSFFLCLTTLIVGNLLTAFAPNFWVWAFCRFIVGLTIPAVYQIPFIISLELVGPNYRSFVTVMTCLFYTLGLLLLALITYLVRDWRHLAIVTTVPFLLYYTYWWYDVFKFLPESPRWLLAKGQLEEALRILEKLASVNQSKLPENFTLKLKRKMMLGRSQSEEKRLKSGLGIMDLLRTPNMRLKTLLITMNWFANEAVYVGLSYYGPALGSNQYVSFFLSCLVEIPSYLVCWLVMDTWGRRWPLSVAMILSGTFCIVTVLLPSDAVTLTLVLFLISKFMISASFLIIYPFAGELYPTEARGIGIGASAYIAGIGLIVIPFITYLGSEKLVLPLVIMGGVSVIGGLSSLRLPETLHHKLPQTLQEGEEFGKDWTFNQCIQCIPTKPQSRTESYEDLDAVEEGTIGEQLAAERQRVEEEIEMMLRRPEGSIKRPTGPPAGRRMLVKQASLLETPFDSSGSMKMTYWF